VHVPAVRQETPSSWLSPVLPGLGLDTTDQVLPFHDSARVRSPPACEPTAMHELADGQDIPDSTLPPAPWSGLDTTDQVLPSHDSTSVCGMELGS
jgi:hypothetical protein